MPQPAPPIEPVYDCLILSGGGAKGAYGAGVAKAVIEYRKLNPPRDIATEKKLEHRMCYIGASAGALNAYLLATKGPNALIEFWLTVTDASTLGVWIKNPKFQGARRWLAGLIRKGQPFSIYSNAALTALIGAQARLADLTAPLIIAATDVTLGELKAFYAADLLDEIAVDDRKQGKGQKLKQWRQIKTDQILAQALLASTAIPVVFPPVKIELAPDETSWYVDGGIGNHTPTREAANFFRGIEKLGRGSAGVAFCVKQDPPRTLREILGLTLSDVTQRTFEVYHYVHMNPIIRGWFRINQEVEEQHKRADAFKDWLKQLKLPQATSDQIAHEVTERFVNLGGHAPRLSAPMVEFEPSIELGDPLDFDPKSAKEHIEHGYTQALGVLHGMKVKKDEVKYSEPLSDDDYFDLLKLSLFKKAS